MTNGQATWNVTDWRTGDTIAEGVGDYDAYGEAGQRLDPDGKWFRIDRIDHIENPRWTQQGSPRALRKPCRSGSADSTPPTRTWRPSWAGASRKPPGTAREADRRRTHGGW
ncbi:hypothetical protein, partial [Streptomyces roseolus]|uniref:hypothetical protein n=1 Tax=Streptomyces roseolus TaxID=67358 RepID=UPI00365DDE58